MFVLDVDDAISSRLGEPTVTALARRFGPDGKCLTCGGRFGNEPLSVRAYRNDHGIIALVAYHAECATSAWLEVGSLILPHQATWAAAVTVTSLRVGVPRWFRWLRGPRGQDQIMPVMLVHPCLEMVRVRQVGAAEAVNSDLEDYCHLGFADPSALAHACPLRPVGQAWMLARGDDVSLSVVVGDLAWLAPVPRRPIAGLVTARGGVLIGVTCDRDPGRLSTDTGYLDSAIGNGEILLGWAPLAASQHKHGQLLPPC